MDELRVICARILGNELVSAECMKLTGGFPDAEGVAVCQDLALVDRSAYITYGLRCYAEAPDLTSLSAQIAAAPISADQFRIEFLRLSPQIAVSKQAAIHLTADALRAYPNLDAPQHRFMVVVQHDRLWFGEILAQGQHAYTRHDAKPYRTSSSLPSRLARALVNLVAPPARSILDPFCGTGSILLEVQALGLTAYGMDWNPKMVGMTRRNLRHYGYVGEILLGNVLECQQMAGALVTDLPYGRLLQADRPGLAAIFIHALQLAPVAVYLADEDLTPLLQQAGYAKVECWRVRKHARMSRYIHLAQRAV
jgi:tRNA G10  N-methylase Trm11